MAIGYTFAPTADNAQQGRLGGSPQTRAQDPLKTLSFQLPRVSGAPSGATMAGSSVGHAVLQSVLRTVLGADAARATGVLPGEPHPSPLSPLGDFGNSRMRDGVPEGGWTWGGGVPTGPDPVKRIPGAPSNPGPMKPPPMDPVGRLSRNYAGVPNFSAAPPADRGFNTFAGGLDRETALNRRSPFSQM